MSSELRVIWEHGRIYGLGRVLDRLAGLLILPVLVHLLPPAEWGLYALVLIVTRMIAVFPMGILYTMVRLYFDHDDEAHRRNVVGTTLALFLLAAAGLAAVAWPFAVLAAQVFFGDQGHSPLFFIANIGLIFVLLFEIELDYFRLKKRSGVYVLVSLVRSFLQFGLSIFFVAAWDMGVEGVVLGHLLAAAAVSLPVGLFVTLDNGLAFSRPVAREMLGLGLPIVPAQLARTSLGLIERYLVNLLAGTASLGIFALASRLAEQLWELMSGPFCDIWEVRLMEIAKTPEKAEEFHRVLIFFLSLLAIAVMALSLFAPEIIMIIAAEDYWGAATALPLFAFTQLVALVGHHFQMALIQVKRTWYLPAVNGAGLIFDVIALYILVPKFGVTGAAMAFLLTRTFRVLGLIYCSARCSSYPQLFPWRSYAVLMALAVTFYGFGAFWIGGEVGVVEGLQKAVLFGIFILAIYAGPIFSGEERKTIVRLVYEFLARIRGNRTRPR